jgi:hypothetical protein
MREAEDKLRQAEADAPMQAVYDYVNATNGNGSGSGSGHAELSPVEAASAELEVAQLEDRRITRLEADLDAELRSAANRRDRAQSQVSAALAALVCASPQFRELSTR